VSMDAIRDDSLCMCIPVTSWGESKKLKQTIINLEGRKKEKKREEQFHAFWEKWHTPFKYVYAAMNLAYAAPRVAYATVMQSALISSKILCSQFTQSLSLNKFRISCGRDSS
jgi:hypothetical protein